MFAHDGCIGNMLGECGVCFSMQLDLSYDMSYVVCCKKSSDMNGAKCSMSTLYTFTWKVWHRTCSKQNRTTKMLNDPIEKV